MLSIKRLKKVIETLKQEPELWLYSEWGSDAFAEDILHILSCCHENMEQGEQAFYTWAEKEGLDYGNERLYFLSENEDFFVTSYTGRQKPPKKVLRKNNVPQVICPTKEFLTEFENLTKDYATS